MGPFGSAFSSAFVWVALRFSAFLCVSQHWLKISLRDTYMMAAREDTDDFRFVRTLSVWASWRISCWLMEQQHPH